MRSELRARQSSECACLKGGLIKAQKRSWKARAIGRNERGAVRLLPQGTRLAELWPTGRPESACGVCQAYPALSFRFRPDAKLKKFSHLILLHIHGVASCRPVGAAGARLRGHDCDGESELGEL